MEKNDKKIIASNRKAFHNYEILESFEAGIVLEGYEVKSLRQSKASLVDGIVRFDKDEAYLDNVHIAPYLQQSTHVIDYNPRRKRKLLLHRREINRLSGRTKEKGLAVIPLELYFSKKNMVKVSLGLGKGKKVYDKREVLRKRDINREMERDIKSKK
ncbi:MAG: SsrA-binding protein SmpB [Elusimicrobia bacterium]|nr:SsrA-binding protein SmpB [Candidatus Liberimonas magnetica]